MFKKLTIQEQAEVLKAAAVLEKKYDPDHVKEVIEHMGGMLDVEEIESVAPEKDHVQQSLFEELEPNGANIFYKRKAEEIARNDYDMPLNDLLVIKYYKEGMSQRQIAEQIFNGQTKQRTISTWLNEVPGIAKRRILGGV